MKQSKESIEEYFKNRDQNKKARKLLEPYLKSDILTAINMCILLNKENFICELGKLLLQTIDFNFWELEPNLNDIQKKIMESPFAEQKLITEQKTKQDLAKEKIVRAIQICTQTLPEDRDLVYKLSILLVKVDYLDYTFIKKGLMKIQEKYLTRLEVHKEKLSYVAKTKG